MDIYTPSGDAAPGLLASVCVSTHENDSLCARRGELGSYSEAHTGRASADQNPAFLQGAWAWTCWACAGHRVSRGTVRRM
jgi:hypothetical protein